ncbi:hypothetical protein P7C70_g7107, partial [Phenoliferia sp. Uapishka_3]
MPLDPVILKDLILSGIHQHNTQPSPSVTLITTCSRPGCFKYVRSQAESAFQRAKRLKSHPSDTETQYWFVCKSSNSGSEHGWFRYRADRPGTRPSSAIILHTDLVAPNFTGLQLLQSLFPSPPKTQSRIRHNPLAPHQTASAPSARNQIRHPPTRVWFHSDSMKAKVSCTSTEDGKLGAPCRYRKSTPPGNCVTCDLHLCIDCCDEWHRRAQMPRTHCSYHSKRKTRAVRTDPFGIPVFQPPPHAATPLPYQPAAPRLSPSVSTSLVSSSLNSWEPSGFQSASAAKVNSTVGGELVVDGTSALAVHVQGRHERTQQFRKVEEDRQAASLRDEEMQARESGQQVQVFVWYAEDRLPKVFPVALTEGLLGKSRGKASVGAKVKQPSSFSLPSGIIDFLSSKAKSYEWSYYSFTSGSYHLWHNLSELTNSTLFPIDYHILPSNFCATLVLRRDDLQIYPGLEAQLESLSELLAPSPPSPASVLSSEEFPEESPSILSHGSSSSSSPSGVHHQPINQKRSFGQGPADDDEDDNDEIIFVEPGLTANEVLAVDMIRIICAEEAGELGMKSFAAFARSIGWVVGALQPGLRKRYRKRLDVAALSQVLKHRSQTLEGLSWGDFIRGHLYAGVRLQPKCAPAAKKAKGTSATGGE